MFGLLARWFRADSARLRPVLRLEALDGRIAPGGAAGGIGGEYFKGRSVVVAVMHIGEEIPQTGGVTDGGRGGIGGEV